MRKNTYKKIDLKYRGLVNDVRFITVEVWNKYLDISEFEIYELNSGSPEQWE
jgi:hypothetical protein